jgi:hypothetical protein
MVHGVSLRSVRSIIEDSTEDVCADLMDVLLDSLPSTDTMMSLGLVRSDSGATVRDATRNYVMVQQLEQRYITIIVYMGSDNPSIVIVDPSPAADLDAATAIVAVKETVARAVNPESATLPTQHVRQLTQPGQSSTGLYAAVAVAAVLHDHVSDLTEVTDVWLLRHALVHAFLSFGISGHPTRVPEMLTYLQVSEPLAMAVHQAFREPRTLTMNHEDAKVACTVGAIMHVLLNMQLDDPTELAAARQSFKMLGQIDTVFAILSHVVWKGKLILLHRCKCVCVKQSTLSVHTAQATDEGKSNPHLQNCACTHAHP